MAIFTTCAQGYGVLEPFPGHSVQIHIQYWYKVNVNGFCSRKFKSSRVVRQGDPLSPLLFIAAKQILSYNLFQLEARGGIRPYKLGRNVACISHLFYAYDMLVFSNGHVGSISWQKQLLVEYERSPGQKINFEKSGFYPSKLNTRVWLHRLEYILGRKARTLTLLYLGAPLFKGRCKAEHIDTLLQKFATRSEGWKTKFLSFARKITLIDSILASLPVHLMSCMVLPKYIIGHMESLLRSFLWNQRGQNRAQWVSWNKVARPFQEGGLGIHEFSNTIHSLHGKLAWRIMEGNSLWSKMLSAKYGVLDDSIQPRQSSSRLWKVFCPHFQNLQRMSRWQVGRGDILFWSSNWSGEIFDPLPSSRSNSKRGSVLDAIERGTN